MNAQSPHDPLTDREQRRWTNWRDATWPSVPPVPRWSTPNQPEEVSDTVTLRRFGTFREDGIPVLVVTPQVNHSYIADFAPDQSLVRTLLGAGVAGVGVTDWLPPPQARSYTIADSLDDIRSCAERLGGRAHLVGLCQGGWQVTLLAALEPACAASLTIAASPIDAHAGSTLLHAFTLGLPLAFFRNLVAMGGGNLPGRLVSAGFNGLKPFERQIFNPAMLWWSGDDDAFIRRSGTLRDWYRLDKDIAGDLYLEAVQHLFMENRLAKGTFEVRGQRVDLSRITCPTFLVAGTRDHITPREQVFALKTLTPQAPCHEYLVEAGHIGVFMGRSSLTLVWPFIGACMR